MTTPCYPALAVPCYAAAYDNASGGSSLLLADVSTTHLEVSSRAEVRAFSAAPPLWQVEKVVDTLAHWHALWWGFRGAEHLPAERLDSFTDEKSYQGYAAHCQNAWLYFTEAEPALAAEVEPLYLPLIEGMLQLWQSYLAKRFDESMNLTLAHGDCYFSQFLAPTKCSGKMFLIDFDSVRLDLPTDDLVLLLSTFWKREARLEHELTMLKRYHNTLCTAGIETYPWEKLLEDYRFNIVQHAMYPIFGKLGGDDQNFWRLRLSAITAAYKDWRCDTFLKSSKSNGNSI